MWPGNTNENIERVPDDNTFVDTDPSTGTSSSYKMKAHTVEIDAEHTYVLDSAVMIKHMLIHSQKIQICI